MFWRKKEQKEEKITVEIGLLWARVAKIDAILDGINLKINSINGRLNRQFGETKTERNKYDDNFDFLRQNGVQFSEESGKRFSI